MHPELEFPFTTINGIDGTGKSTTANKLVELLIKENIPAINYETFSKTSVENPVSIIKRRMIEIGNPEAQFFLFLTSTIYHSSIIKKLQQKLVVVKDSGSGMCKHTMNFWVYQIQPPLSKKLKLLNQTLLLS